VELVGHRVVVVVHENRGLNPHIEDIARRIALAGYLALAPTRSPAGAATRATRTTRARGSASSTRASAARTSSPPRVG
jgi:dienelactone hydrolase